LLEAEREEPRDRGRFAPRTAAAIGLFEEGVSGPRARRFPSFAAVTFRPPLLLKH
jgi:hypothetical protein